MAALVEEQAGIGRHRFLRGKAAVRAGQYRFEHHGDQQAKPLAGPGDEYFALQ